MYKYLLLSLLLTLSSIELVEGFYNINNIKLNRNIPKSNIPKSNINEKTNNSIQLYKDLLLISVLTIHYILIYISKNIYIIIIIILINKLSKKIDKLYLI